MVLLFLANGFEMVEALTPLDVLRRAGADVRTVGIGGCEVRSTHGVTVTADLADTELDPAVKPEMVILPGGMPGASNLDQSPVVDRVLAEAAGRGAFLAAICAAPFALGKRGYLRGRRAVCFPEPKFISQLKGADYQNEAVVRDGNVITARAMGSANEFALTLVEALYGREKADAVAASYYYAR